MSQDRDQSGGFNNKMAISYASGLPADNQALPSFREVRKTKKKDQFLFSPHVNEWGDKEVSILKLCLDSCFRHTYTKKSSRPHTIRPDSRASVQHHPTM